MLATIDWNSPPDRAFLFAVVMMTGIAIGLAVAGIIYNKPHKK